MGSSSDSVKQFLAGETLIPATTEEEPEDEDDAGRVAFNITSSVTSVDTFHFVEHSLGSDPMLTSVGFPDGNQANFDNAFALGDGARDGMEGSTAEEVRKMPGVLEVHELLGKGSFGSVFRCEVDVGTISGPVAIKAATGMSRIPIREMQVLGSLDHPNLVKMYLVLEGPPVCLILELCTGGDLQTFMHAPRGRCVFESLSSKQRGSVLIDVSQAIRYLHSMAVVHRDIKSGNCLLISPMLPEAAKVPSVKLADFGLSRFAQKAEGTPIMTMCTGTMCYMAPEVAVSNRYDMAADIYSCAILFNEILSGQVPFGKGAIHWRLTIDVGKGMRPPLASLRDIDVGDDLGTLIESCWHHDPKQRLSAGELSDSINFICG